MSDKKSPPSHSPTSDPTQHLQTGDPGFLILFVNAEAAARYLSLEVQTLKSYRILGRGPIFHKFGRGIRYAVDDLNAWATACRRKPPSGSAPDTPSPTILHRQWPTPDILQRARFVTDAGPIRFLDTLAAAQYLALEAHTLECYRSLGGGPLFHKFGKWIRYAMEDLDAWAASRRRPGE